MPPPSGWTPLHFAAAGDASRALVPLLLAAGADVRATNANGDTPLHDAADSGNAAAARLLLS